MKHSPTNTTNSNQAVNFKFLLGAKGIVAVDFLPLKKGANMTWEIEGSSKVHEIEKLINAWMSAYLKKQQPSVDLPIVLEGLPPFTLHVLAILRSIPFGVSLTYQELAEIAGTPNGARAVGTACGRNPCPLIIPCHRVLSSRGIGGFSAGIDIKKALLAFEGIL